VCVWCCFCSVRVLLFLSVHTSVLFFEHVLVPAHSHWAGRKVCVCVCGGVAFVLFVFCYFCLCTRVFCLLYMYWFQPILTGPEERYSIPNLQYYRTEQYYGREKNVSNKRESSPELSQREVG
jgi:hypothetical protein